MRELYRFIRRFMVQQPSAVLFGILLSLITLMAGISLLALSGWFIAATAAASLSYAVASQFNYFLPAAAVRFFSLLRIIGRYGERVLTHQATFKILTDIRLWFYRQLEPLAPAHLLSYHSGDLLTRMVADIDALDNLYIRVLTPTVSLILISIFLLLGLAGLIDWFLAVTVLCLMGITALLVPLFTACLAHSSSQALTQKQAQLQMAIINYLQGLAEFKLFSQDQAQQQQLQAHNQAFIQLQQRMSIYRGIGAALLSLLLGITLLLAVWITVGLVAEHQLNGALIALVALSVMAISEAIMPLPTAYQYLGKTIAAAKRITHICQQQPCVTFRHEENLSMSHYDIEYRNISFAYDPKSCLIQNFNCHIQQNEKIAIMGCTGSGKSTLIHLLARVWDVNSGHISIGGIALQEFPEAQLRSMMNLVTQHAHIFDGTIRDNLLLAVSTDNISDDSLWQVLQQVELDTVIADLPQGLDSRVGEQGCYFSGGQKKRLVIARALLKDAPIIILDEPSEGLDRITADKLLTSLEKNCNDKTLIVVTHDKRVAQRMDRIIDLTNHTAQELSS